MIPFSEEMFTIEDYSLSAIQDKSDVVVTKQDTDSKLFSYRYMQSFAVLNTVDCVCIWFWLVYTSCIDKRGW